MKRVRTRTQREREREKERKKKWEKGWREWKWFVYNECGQQKWKWVAPWSHGQTVSTFSLSSFSLSLLFLSLSLSLFQLCIRNRDRKGFGHWSQRTKNRTANRKKSKGKESGHEEGTWWARDGKMTGRWREDDGSENSHQLVKKITKNELIEESFLPFQRSHHWRYMWGQFLRIPSLTFVDPLLH